MSGLRHDPGTADEAAARARARAATVAVVSGPADRAALLAEIGRRLRFPGWFGHNLDALEECLRDLSWLPEGPVELVWADAPLRDADPHTHRVVRDILESAVDATAEGPRPLQVVLVDADGGPGT